MKLPFPMIDNSRHLTPEVLEARFAEMAPSPKDHGTVSLLMARAPERMRILPERVLLDEQGMPDDAWGRSEEPKPNEQLAVMNHRVASMIANGQSLALFGDNLSLDLDLSEENLPAGTQLRLGGALVEVTPKAHTGCKNYAARFGTEALKFISAMERRDLHLRGVYFRVLESGEVAVGDPVVVVR